MILLVRLLFVVALSAASLPSQVAQIGVKGRTREGGQASRGPQTANPLHQLPRRIAAEELVIPPHEEELERERMRDALPPPRLLPEDRTRAVVRRELTARPIPPLAIAPIDPPYPRPRRLPEDGSLAGLLPAFEIPPGSQHKPQDKVPRRGGNGLARLEAL